MIENNWEHIIQLILEEINDIISDKDKAYLYHRIAEDEEVYQLYMRTHAELGSEKVRRALENSPKKIQVKEFIKFAAKQVRIWWVALLIIAIVKSILIGFGVRYLVRDHMEKEMKAARMSAVNSSITSNQSSISK